MEPPAPIPPPEPGPGLPPPPTSGPVETSPPPPRSHRWLWALLGLLILAALLAAYLLLFKDKTAPAAKSSSVKSATASAAKPAPPYLVFYDDNAKTVTMTDKSGKAIYKTVMPKADFYSFVSASTDRQTLLSVYNQSSNTNNYAWLDSQGRSKTIDSAAQKSLQGSNSSTLPIKFIDSGKVATASCTEASGHNNNCVVSSVDLADGSSRQLLKMTAPAYATGESLLDMIGLSRDGTQLYVYVGGPSSLGNQQNAVFDLDLVTLKTTKLYELPATRSGDNMTISADAVRLVYDDVADANNSKIYTVNLATGQEQSVDWHYSLISNGYTFNWSPDNSHILVAGNNFMSGGNVGLAVIDVSANKVTDLTTITDSAHNQVQHIYWLDSKTAVYGLETTTTSNDFRGSTSTIHRLDTATKSTSDFQAPPGYLIDVSWQ